MHKSILLSALLFATICLSAQTYYQGRLITASLTSKNVWYTVDESNAGNFYMATFKIYDGNKKSLLAEVNLVNNIAADELSWTCKQNGKQVSQVLQYNAQTGGLFYTNNPFLDKQIDTTAAANDEYEYIFSFRDTSRTTPTLHKVTLPDGNIVLLDKISVARLERHRSVMAAGAEALATARQELQKRKEAELIAAEQKRVEDSVLAAATSAQKKIAEDSLNQVLFSRQLVAKARNFYTRWDSLYKETEQIKGKIQAQYVQQMDNMRETTIEGEYYAGGRYRRRKEGNGILVVHHPITLSNGNRLTEQSSYLGSFSNDAFTKGDVIQQLQAQTFIGHYDNGVKAGLGYDRFITGNYHLGLFVNDVFTSGVSHWYTPESGEYYFGEFAGVKRVGYGELVLRQKNKYIGEFENSVIANGFGQETDDFGNVTYWKFENSVKIIVSATVAEPYFDSIAAVKQEYSLLRINTIGNTALPVDTIKIVPVKKFKVPHFIGLTLGTSIPFLTFSEKPTFAILGPAAALDSWFRLANAIGIKIRIGCNTYSVAQEYNRYISSKLPGVQTDVKYDAMWFAHYYNAGFGLNLGGRVGSLELNALGGLALVHQPLYDQSHNKVAWDKARPCVNFQGEAAIRINCSKKFGLRFGATYFLCPYNNFYGYSYNKTGFFENIISPNASRQVLMHSINPFISFVGLF
ncbi:MAG: hypothetical protein RLZZ367_316 [Bacteroidota bacterium]|jgi:hypothetical protein